MHDLSLPFFHNLQKFVFNNLLLHGVPYVDSAVEEVSQGILRRISSTFLPWIPVEHYNCIRNDIAGLRILREFSRNVRAKTL